MKYCNKYLRLPLQVLSENIEASLIQKDRPVNAVSVLKNSKFLQLFLAVVILSQPLLLSFECGD